VTQLARNLLMELDDTQRRFGFLILLSTPYSPPSTSKSSRRLCARRA